MRSLVIGFGLGFFVALQLGPMSLFLVRTTLRTGLRAGIAIGCGIALVDALYAMLGALGAAPFLTIDVLRLVLGLSGAVVLAWLGFRTLWSAMRVRAGLETPAEVGSARRAFLTSVAGTASNPLTIASWAAVFAAASTGASASPVPLVIGVGIGSLAWMSSLAVVTGLSRRMLGPRIMRFADITAGLGMVGFAGVMGYRAVSSDD